MASRMTAGKCSAIARKSAAPRGLAQIGEVEPGHASRGPRDDERAPLYGEGGASAGGVVGQLGEGVFERLMRRLAERVVIDRFPVQPGKAIIPTAVEFQHKEFHLSSAINGRNRSRCRPCS
jgi:hypothetical protein